MNKDWMTSEGYISVRKLREDLLAQNLPPNRVDQIIEMFWFRDYHTAFVCLDFVYPEFVKFIKQNSKVIFSRLNFYDYYYGNQPTIKANLLGITAFSLAAEKLCKNEFSKEEIESICKTSKINLDTLIDQKILKHQEEKYLTSHHTITEYFVAKKILEAEKPISVFSGLSVLSTKGKNPEVFFSTSWYGVALFLLDSKLKSQTVDLFIELAEKNPTNIDQNFAECLSQNPFYESNDPRKEKLFDLIYKGTKNSGIWISSWAEQGLANLYTPNKLSLLIKDLLPTPSVAKDVVIASNAVTVLGELIVRGAIDNKTKEILRSKFIEYTKQRPESGVLQRRSLSALEGFKDPTVIDEIAPIYKELNSGVRDQLVSEAFLSLCYTVAPNKTNSIDFYIDAIDSEASVYAWQGLKKITDDSSLIYLLKTITQNDKLLSKIIDGESIFLSTEEGETNDLLDHLAKLSIKEPKRFLKLSQKIIYQACELDDYYPDFTNSIFIDFLIDKSVVIDSGLSHNIFKAIPKKWSDTIFENFISILARSVTRDNYKEIYQQIKTRAGSHIGSFIRNVKDSSLRTILVEIHWGKQPAPEKVNTLEDQYVKEFHKKLYPDPNNKEVFMTDVFKYFIQSQKQIGKLSKKDNDRLWNLAYTQGIVKHNPANFQVKINLFGSSKNFNWSKQASFYGDMIRVVQALKPDTDFTTFREKLIAFIPFAYSDDLTTISEIIKTVKEKEIKALNLIFLNSYDDRRYLNPDSYIRFVIEMQENGSQITSPKAVLESFLEDKKIDDWAQTSSIEALHFFAESNDKTLKNKLIKLAYGTGSIASAAIEALIRIFKDKKSIDSRFQQIKSLAKEKRIRQFHTAYTLDEDESEYSNLYLPKVLIDLNDPKLAKQFLELLSDSLQYIEKSGFDAYVGYINKTVFSYFKGIASEKNYKYIKELEKIVGKSSMYWNYQLSQLKVTFLTRKENI